MLDEIISKISLIDRPISEMSSYSRLCPMATGVGRGRVCLASFNSTTGKTLCYTHGISQAAR